MALRKPIQIFYLLLFFLPSLTNCSKSDTPSAAPSSTRITNVAVYTLRPDSLVQYSLFPATARAWQEVIVRALENGIVTRIYKTLADSVAQRESLALLAGAVLNAQATEASAEHKLQTYNFKRAAKLFKEGSVSEQDYYTAEYNQKRAESRLQSLQRRQGFLNIRAPFSGQIAERYIELGQVIGVGGPAFRLVRADTIRVEAWVPENQIIDFSAGSQAWVMFDAYPDRLFPGRIDRIGPTADADHRVFPIEVVLPNANGAIRPGMIGKLKALRRTYQKAVIIPREAVLEREAGPAAFVVIDSLAHLRPLTLGASEAGRVVVTHGLHFQDRLVVRGGRDLIDGDRVRITETLDR